MNSVSALADPFIIPNPYPTYAALRGSCSVHWITELNAWGAFSYETCMRTLRDQRFLANRMDEVLQSKFPREALKDDHIYCRFTKNTMMYSDGAVHTALRNSTRAAFNSECHVHYAEVIKRVAEELVAEIPSGTQELDAVSNLTSHMPVRAAVQPFGVPKEDLGFILPRVEMIISFFPGPKDQPTSFAEVTTALEELHTYALELVQGRRGEVPSGTVIARLVESQPEQTETTLQQTIHQLVLLLIALFAPTTPGSLSSGLLAFLKDRDQIAVHKREEAARLNTADEIFRYNASNQFTWRVAQEDVELDGRPVLKGHLVVAFLGAANRDPLKFVDPDRFLISRQNSGEHLSLGAGAHACLGRRIATYEINCFFDALFRRFPNIALAGEPVWNSNLEFRALRSLPVSLGTRKAA